MTDRTLVVIPCWNEVRTVGTVVRGVRTHLPDADVLVVDDASTDGSRRQAQEAGALVLTLSLNLGVGGAMRAGYLYATRQRYACVVQVDADGQHDPAQVPQLLAALHDSDLVIGARFAGAGVDDIRGPRRWSMRLLAAVLSRVAGVPLTDTTSGFRACNARTAELFSRHYAVEYLGDTVEAIVLAARAGLRISQVPVVMHDRVDGSPSAGPIRAGLYLARVALALSLARFRRFPTRTGQGGPP